LHAHRGQGVPVEGTPVRPVRHLQHQVGDPLEEQPTGAKTVPATAQALQEKDRDTLLPAVRPVHAQTQLCKVGRGAIHKDYSQNSFSDGATIPQHYKQQTNRKT